MFKAYVAVAVLAAGAYGYAAAADFVRPGWIVANMSRLGVPDSWTPYLGVLKGLGALGLVVGIAVPLIGVAAAVGLVLFFVGAVVTAVRARCYEHLPYPSAFLLPALGALVLRLLS